MSKQLTADDLDSILSPSPITDDELDRLLSGPSTPKSRLEASGLPVTADFKETAPGKFEVSVPLIGAPNPSVAAMQQPETTVGRIASKAAELGARAAKAAEGVDVLGPANNVLEAIHKPAAWYEKGIDEESARPTTGQPTSQVFLDEAMRQSAKLVGGFVLDPLNWPFLLAGGPEVRPALRLGVDALFGAMQTVQTTQALKNVKWDDPSTWTEPAKNAAFAMLGWSGMGKAVKDRFVAQAKAREEVTRTDRAVQQDAEAYKGMAEAARKRTAQQVASTRPNQAERRATIEVPETNTPEDPTQRFSDAELEELTRPEPQSQEPAAATAPPVAPETTPQPQADPAPTPRPETPVAAQPAAPPAAPITQSLDFSGGQLSDADLEQLTAPAPKEESQNNPIVSQNNPTAAENLPPLLLEAERLKNHPVRAKEPETVRNSEFNNFEQQVRSLAERNLPSLIPDIDEAVRLHDEGDTGNAIAKLEVVRQELHGAGRKLAEAAGRKVGIELPPEEPAVEAAVPPQATRQPKAPVVQEQPKTARDKLIWDEADNALDRFRQDFNPNKRSLIEWLKSKGGVRDDGGDLASREPDKNRIKNSKGSLIQSKTGLPMDTAREMAAEAGYLPKDSSLSDFKDLIDQELRGRKVYSLLHDGVALEESPLRDLGMTPEAVAKELSKPVLTNSRIRQAFRDAAEETHGEDADNYLSHLSDEEKQALLENRPSEEPSLLDGTDALNFEGGESKPTLGTTPEEAMTLAAAGRRPELLKEGKAFDEQGLVNSELFGGRGGAQQFLGTDERAEPDDGDISFDFGDEKGSAPILMHAAAKVNEMIDWLKDHVDISPIPRLTKAGVQPEAVAHASARIAVPRMINDMLGRVFPEDYRNPEAMAKTMRVMVLDNILGGYDSINRAADFARSHDDARTAGRLDKMAENIEKQHDLEGYADEVHAATNDPAVSSAIERWKQVVNPEMDRLYNEMKGVDAETPREGRGRIFGARVNLLANSHTPEWLKAVTDEEAPVPQQPSPALSSYRNPDIRKDRFDRRAAFSAADYSDDPVAVLASSFYPRWNEVTKRRLYDALVEKGAASWTKPESGMINGQEVRSAPVDVPETKNGKTSTVRKMLWLPKDLGDEFHGVLGTDQKLKMNALGALLTKLQLAQLADATSHLKNIHSVIAGAQGTKGLMADLGRKIPGISSVDALVRIGSVMHEISQDTPAIRTELADMAKQGMLRQHFPATGLQRITKMQDLIHNVDTASRVVMNRFYANLVDRGLATDSLESRRAFVQQIGEYNRRLMGPLMRSAAQSGLSPFIVAGRNFNRYSRRLLVGSPGFQPASRSAAVQARAVNLVKLGSMVVIPAMLNRLVTGNIYGRPGTPIGAIDLGGKEDAKGNHKVLDLLQLYGIRRGMRGTGVQALVEGLQNGDSANDIVGKAIFDAAGTGLHPWLGPGIAFGVSALTGNRMDLRGGPMPEQAEKMEGKGSQFAENMRVALKNQNLLLYDLTGARNASHDVDESAAKDFVKDFLKAPASAVGISDRPTPALQAARDLATHVQATPEQKARGQVRRQILAAYDSGDAASADKLRASAVKTGQLSPGQATDILRERKMTPIERATWRESLDNVMDVWDKASPDEKKILRRVIARKVSNTSLTPDQRKTLLPRAQKALRAPAR